MPYIFYDSDGVIRQQRLASYVNAADIPAGYGYMTLDVSIDISRLRVNLADFTLEALPEPGVTADQINRTRDRLREQPVTVTLSGTAYTFDYDNISRELMAGQLRNWAYTTETKFIDDGIEKVAWKMADNSIALFTELEWETVVSLCDIEAAKRTDRLYAHTRLLISQLPNVALSDLDEANWPMTS